MTELAETIGRAVAAHSGSLARSLAILVATLHHSDVIDGRAIARAIRLDKTGRDNVDMISDELADLIVRIIERAETEGPLGLKPVDD